MFNLDQLIDEAVIRRISSTSFPMDGKQHRLYEMELRQHVESAIEAAIADWELNRVEVALYGAYYYEIPVIVRSRPDDPEDDYEPLPVRPDVINRVTQELVGSEMERWLRMDERYRDVRINSFSFTPSSTGVRVKATTFKPYSAEDEEKIRLYLSGQCSDGWGENGWEWYGFHYGYTHRHIKVDVWRPENDVETLNQRRYEGV